MRYLFFETWPEKTSLFDMDGSREPISFFIRPVTGLHTASLLVRTVYCATTIVLSCGPLVVTIVLSCDRECPLHLLHSALNYSSDYNSASKCITNSDYSAIIQLCVLPGPSNDSPVHCITHSHQCSKVKRTQHS